MAETQLLEKIADEVSFLNDRIIHIEEELNEIKSELHEVRPGNRDEGKSLPKYLKYMTKSVNFSGCISIYLFK